ncbi:HAD family hydrolase [Candidatus Paracaedibacter symbiosus]|uniref:HAD family hydrolase n=1 Tax=Candidatus Paracaedibacter symbiosus TaxID=244582 RepID=UPI0005094B2C|nr:HAD family hydrolase [Candidatus Paracaedibacter symbiosus]
MPKKLMIFDCDGVLVDSEIIAHRVVAEALQKVGCAISVEESIRYLTGINRQHSRELLREMYGVNISDAFWEEEQERVIKAFEGELNALNLDVLQKLSYYKTEICLASSSQRRRVITALSVTNQLQYFEGAAIFTSQQVKHGKPAPDLFLLAASTMGYAPKECVVIEDSPAGVEAGLAAGMTVIGCSHARFPWYQEWLKTYPIQVSSL